MFPSNRISHMTPDPHLPLDRALAWTSPLTIVALLAVAAFFLLGLRGVLAPQPAARSLGVTIADARDLTLMQTTGARNMGLALLGLALVLIDARRPFGFLLGAAALIACMDFAVVFRASGMADAAKHIAYVVFLAGFSAVMLGFKQ
jgi:Domain of unknown function (DUF4267)